MYGWLEKTASARPWVLILVVWAWLYLPCLGTPELHQEEGRRAGTAREMLSRGEYVMPVFQGQPYLQKPPGYYWMLIASSRALGGFNEWSIRLPSALSVLICAVAVCAITRKLGGNGLVGGMALLVMPEAWGKGQLGEIEAVFMAQVFLAIALAWRAANRPRGYAAAIASGLFLGWAVVTKGPAAPALFYLAMAVWLAWERRARWFLSLQHVCIVFAMAAITGLWVALLARRIDLANAGRIWANELGAVRLEKNVTGSLKALLVFPFGVFGGLLPGTLALIWMACREPKDEQASSLRRRLLSGTVPGFLLLWLHGRRARYVLPVAPIAAIAAGIAFAAPLARWLRSRRFVAVAVAAILLAGVVRIGVMQVRGASIENRETGAELARVLPANTPVYSDVGYWDACFYANRTFVAVADAASIPSSAAAALVFKNDLPKLDGRIRRILYEGEMRHGDRIVAVELAE